LAALRREHGPEPRYDIAPELLKQKGVDGLSPAPRGRAGQPAYASTRAASFAISAATSQGLFFGRVGRTVRLSLRFTGRSLNG
jgi:hypothetical protein